MTEAAWRELLPAPLPGRPPWEALEAYALELEHWNRAVRLVGPRDLPGIRLQIADALSPFLLAPPSFPLLDIGSGAGLPALPVALAFPGRPVVCLEPLGKRVSFLRHAARVLRLPGVRVVQSRIEDALALHPDLAGAFACATARAVADPGELLFAARPFLLPSGEVFLLRGSAPPHPHCGWELVRDLTYPPPPGLGPRRLQVYRKLE